MARSQPVRVKYPDAVLVCRECHGDSKHLAKQLKRALHDVVPRPRIVRTSCLDVCPKRDVCVAYAGSGTLFARVVDDDGIASFAHAVVAARE
jgi:hypothetical protein